MKKVQRGHVTLKCWDIGGQPRFRTMWERYCRGVSAIVFIVDIADTPLIPQAKEELHDLMSRKSLEGIPLLILGNKSDLPDKLSVDELIDELDLKSIRGREVCCYGIKVVKCFSGTISEPPVRRTKAVRYALVVPTVTGQMPMFARGWDLYTEDKTEGRFNSGVNEKTNGNHI
ncbi:uncharacterized protein FIESC28_11550 [Fusarium coffeatum]|uniref:Uncharacterized protein n=1 Tax=Fusarium coffeatum TaxID=231269 RepID=A0A366QJS0_9HYPO|nr:uncharacterized protein FIESC28_11550 [Fusarium coffeatum]RBR04498.1 hypothetical protein FIESC28_11550 [Fusarium coffeatum]